MSCKLHALESLYLLVTAMCLYSTVVDTVLLVFQQIDGVSPTGRYTTAVPLLFVLSCSAIKEIIEDYVSRPRSSL